MLYRQIILEWGQDTESGVWGLGYSPDNGKNFYVLNTTHGRKYRAEDGNRLYPYISDQIQDKIDTVVAPAKSAADSAVAYANDAIENSRVNSQAIDDINSAVSDAKQGANDALSRAMSAWDAAQSNVNLIDLNYASASASISSARTEAIAAADEAKKSASAAQADIVVVKSSVAAVQADVTATKSDVAVAKSDIADTKTSLTIQANSLSSYVAQASAEYASTASALSDAKTALTSDVAVAKNLANAAQTTANNAVESAGENTKALTSQANALSDARKAMDSGIANAKELANTAQTTADSAIKSASSVANDLAAVASQAKSNANGITKVTSDVGLLQTTVADNTGDISTIQETAKQIQQSVSDNAGNITVAKQTADSAATVASDAKSNATVAVQTASEASVTAKNAQGDAATAMVTAQGAVTQASDAKSNATIAVQTASEASLTATNAQGDASIAKQTASETSTQIKTAQGDISKLQTQAGKIEASVANNSGAIADVQATANQLKASVSDNSGNITVATQTAQGAVTVASDAKSNATVAIQTASQASITAKNASGQAASAVFTANGAMTTASNAKSDATVAVQTASGASLTAINANSDATVAKQTASEAKVQASNAKSDFAQLSIRAGKIEASVANNSGAIASVQQTANGLTTTVGNVDDRVKKIEDTTNWTTKTGALDMDTLTTTQNIYYRDTNLKNADGEAGWAYIQVVSTGERVTQTVWHDRSSIQHTRTGAVSGSSYNWDAWNKVATYSQVAEVKQTIDGITTTINDPKTGLNATYQTAAGNATTISNAQGDIAKLQTRADGFDAEFATANGNISKLQADATGTTQTLANTKSDVAVLQSRADGLDAKYADAAGDINKLEANASGFSQTLTNAQGDISTLKSTVSGVQTTLTDAQGNISTLQSDVSGLKKTTSDNAGNISTLQSTAKTLTSQMSSAQGDISTLKQTASGFSSKVSGMEKSLANANNRLDNLKVGTSNLLHHSDTFDGWYKGNSVTVTSDKYLNGTIAVLGNTGIGGGSQIMAYLDGPYDNQSVTWTVYAKADNAGDKLHTELWGGGGCTDQPLANNWQVYQFTGQRNVDHHDFYLWGCQGNKGNIYVALPFAVVGNAIGTWEPNSADIADKITANTTAIDQNKNAITLKADQTTVDKANGTVQQLKSQLKVQADQINSKVSSSDLDARGYATQEYTQTQIKQTSDSWNLNLTTLKTDVNAIKTTGGGVNLLQGTAKIEFPLNFNGGTQTVQKYDDETNYIQHTSNTPINNMGPWWPLTPEVGQTYTLSADVCGNGYIQGSTFHYEGGGNNSLDRVDLTNNWQRISNTFRVDRINGNWVIYAYNSTLLKVKHIKLEKGTVAHDWSPAPSDMATVTSVTNLSATVNGIKGLVETKASQSEVTQLSNLVQSKVSSDDFTSTTTQLKNLINQRVQVGDVISQINQEAGGDTLIQVSNGKKSLILDAENTIVTGKEWIPDAAIGSISADKVMLGSSSLYNSDGSLNLVNTKDGTTSKISVTQGSVNFDGVNKTASIIRFASDNNTNAFTVNPTGATVTPTLFFERFDQPVGHWLGFTRNSIQEEGVAFNTWDNDGERFAVACRARFEKNLRTLGTLSQGTWDGTTAKPEAGVLTIKSGNTIWSGSDFLAVGSNVTGTYTGVWAKAFVQQSTLSAKTNIETVDPKYALDLVNKTDIRSYQYKSDVAQGYNKRYTSLIIDDVNDVSKYYAPNEFTNEERTGRDDGSAVGYLFLAVQELTRRIKNLEEKLHE
ncbi:hypothetical protein [Limosilactobacillus fermentum]|uniref:hypothetical protein n=1 Tax=Limosilactobacillus fermentum TaxID=1613 RepID=UPI0019667D05|nr:hypothetical protein [Limosilactobacillus fermentum]MBM9561279.1 hypothetical protein [Limosilactobacillus fermentum]